MSPERWERIKDVAFSAIEREEETRARFLEEACGGDSDLRRAVDELIEEHQRPGDTLARAIGAVAAGVPELAAQTKPSMIGQVISHYKVIEKLGAGGMGVVYKAEDTKLKRRVALKFLANHLLGENEEKTRFIREAQAAASLDHPNICTVYEIDEIDGQTFIAMACVEGQSIKQKIEARPLKLDEALDIAIQTAQGLRAAHQKGIVHRDVKPANLMLTGEGQVKIMDFGLAQLAERSRLTKTTTILGTPAYMSPEQTNGTEVDHRTDIWALGVVLYEIVTGQQPFKGHYDKAVMYSITNEQPEPLTALRTGVPMELERIVGKALAKDREERYQGVEEMIVDLRSLGKKLASGKAQTGGPSILTSPRARESEAEAASTAPARPPARERLAWLVAAFCFAGMVALAMFSFRQTPSQLPRAPLRRFAFTPPVALLGGNPYLTAGQNTIALSPDGKHIVFVARDPIRLWIHDFDLGTSRPLEGTEEADVPFWSPGSDFIGYSTGSQIRTIPARGGVSIQVYQGPLRRTHSGSDPGAFGAAWSPDGNSIVFSQDGKLYEVPARGGAAQLLVSAEEPGQSSGGSPAGPTGLLHWPHFLPPEAGARILVYTFGSTSERAMMVHDLASGRREVLGPGELPFYSPSGHLLYQAGPMSYDLWALPFSLDKLQAAGPAFPIAKNGRLPMVASDQTLVYLDAGVESQTLAWLDRHGTRLAGVGQPTAGIGYPRFSADGKRAAVSAVESGNRDIFVYDLTRNIKTRLTSDPADDMHPTWTRSGEEITFASGRSGNGDIFRMSADGVGAPELLVGTPLQEADHEWSSDGQFLVYNIIPPDTGHDIWYAKRKADGSLGDPVKFLQTPFSERIGSLSPNGRFLAFSSDQSGQFEVYVRTFPQGRGGGQVSVNGGTQPRWSRDGKELFYVKDGTLWSVPVKAEGDFTPGLPVQLFENPGLLWGGANAQYDVSANGQFLVKEYVASEAPSSISIVQNWYEEFRDRQQD